MTLISLPAWMAKTRSTPLKDDAISSSVLSRLMYASIVSLRAPGLEPEIESAISTMAAYGDSAVTSSWCASIALMTVSFSPNFRAISAPARA